LNKVKVVATHSIFFFSVHVHVNLYLPEGRSSVQALSTIRYFSNLHWYSEDHGLLLLVKFRNEHTVSCVFTYHDTQMCLTITKLMKTFGKSLFFSTSFVWTIYHSGKHSTTFVKGVCRKEFKPLCRVIFTTVLSKWQLQQPDETCEAPKYRHLWNKWPMGHSRWSLAILLTIQILLDVTLCYWVHSSQHSFVLHFFVITILQIALNRTIHPSVCMYVCMKQLLNHWKVKTEVYWDVLLCS